MIEILTMIGLGAILYFGVKLGYGLFHFTVNARLVWRYLVAMAKSHDPSYTDIVRDTINAQKRQTAAALKKQGDSISEPYQYDENGIAQTEKNEQSIAEEMTSINNELAGLDQGQPSIFDSLDRVRELHARKADILGANPHLRGRE